MVGGKKASRLPLPSWLPVPTRAMAASPPTTTTKRLRHPSSSSEDAASDHLAPSSSFKPPRKTATRPADRPAPPAAGVVPARKGKNGPVRYIPGLTPPPPTSAGPASVSRPARSPVPPSTSTHSAAVSRPPPAAVSKPGPSGVVTPSASPAAVASTTSSEHRQLAAAPLPDVGDDGFVEVLSRGRRRNRAQDAAPLPAHRPSPPPVRRASRTSVSVSRPPPVPSDFPAFRVPVQEGFATSYDAVANLEDLHPEIRMRNIPGRDGSSVLVPLTEESYNILDGLASAPDAPVSLLKLDAQANTNKAIVMGYPVRMPVELLKRHPTVEEATRCVRTRYQWDTRQVLVTLRGPIPPHIDLGNWGTFYLRPYMPEPLRCFRCQQFGHHQATCKKKEVCGICSALHPTRQCMTKYKANEAVRTRCPNCSGNHHAWNKLCPERLRRVEQGRERQVAWVREQQEKTATPAPPGTFVWGQQRGTQAPAPPPATLSPQDFPALPTVAPPSQPAAPPTPQPPPPPQLPPGSLVLTEDLLRSFAKELTLSVAQVFQKVTGVTVDEPKLEEAVSNMADRVTSRLVVKARTLHPTFSAPRPLPRTTAVGETAAVSGVREAAVRPKQRVLQPRSVTHAPLGQASSACASGIATD